MSALFNIKQFNTPALLVDEQICRNNISQMSGKARSHGIIFRPHFKTHQSIEVGHWFYEEGVRQITVSSVNMARFFADAGWKDITLAFPVNVRELAGISQLTAKIRLNVLFDMAEQAKAMTETLTSETGFFIKIDTGYHRSGVHPANEESIEKILRASTGSSLTFRGFLTHAGHTYHAGSKQEILHIHEQSIQTLSELKHKYASRYQGIISSAGDTPSCSLATDFNDLDEMRPGNFVFYDLMQLQLGSCSFDQIAAAVICPVVSVYPQRNEALILGGGVHLSKESLVLPGNKKVFGLVVPFIDGKWQQPEGDDYLVSLSQEHGIFATQSLWAKKLKPGNLVAVIPVHSCLAANLLRKTNNAYSMWP